MAACHLFASITFRKGVAPHQNFSMNPCVRRRTFLLFEEGQFIVFEEGQSLCSKKDFPCVRRRTFLVFEEGQSLCSKKDIPCVRRRAFLVFDEGHSLCSKKDNPCVRRRTFPNRKTCKDSKIARIAPIWTIFVRN